MLFLVYNLEKGDKMAKKVFVVEIPKKLDQEFRKQVKKQGKQFNLSLEEAMKLWIENNSREN